MSGPAHDWGQDCPSSGKGAAAASRAAQDTHSHGQHVHCSMLTVWSQIAICVGQRQQHPQGQHDADHGHLGCHNKAQQACVLLEAMCCHGQQAGAQVNLVAPAGRRGGSAQSEQLCCGGGRAKRRRLPCGGRPAVPAGSHGSQDGEVAALQTGRQQTGLVHWWEASHSDCSCQTTLHERQRPAGQQAPTHCWKQNWRCSVLQSVTTRYSSLTTARKRLLPAAT